MLDVAPSQDASDHQDYYILKKGNPNLNLHLPRLHPGRGATPNISPIYKSSYNL